MGAKRSIRSYIGPGGAAFAVLAGLLLLTLLCALTGSRERPGRAGTPTAFELLETGSDTSAYLDVVAVSEAICTFGPDRFYYVAEDENLSFRLVCLNTAEYDALSAQRDYWNSLTDAPEPFRLVGRKYPVPDEVKQSFLTVFGMESDSFEANFGTDCLITQPAPEPVHQRQLCAACHACHLGCLQQYGNVDQYCCATCRGRLLRLRSKFC